MTDPGHRRPASTWRRSSRAPAGSGARAGRSRLTRGPPPRRGARRASTTGRGSPSTWSRSSTRTATSSTTSCRWPSTPRRRAISTTPWSGVWHDEDFGTSHVYDALHDRDAMACWLRSFDAQPEGPLEFRRLPGHDLDLETHSTLFSGEQSNSSVAFGEDSLMKVFRKITPGTNPDIAVHEVLTRAGSDHVAALYGWLEAKAPDDVAGEDGPPAPRDAPAVPAHGQRRLGPGPGQRPQPVHRGRPARRRGGRRLRRRVRPAGHRARRDPRDARRELPAGRAHARRGDRAGRRHAPAAGRGAGDRARPRGARRPAADDVRPRAPDPRASPSSRSTATCTSGRPCAPCAAGRSWTSRASRPSRSPSGSGPTPAGATSPGCSARSTTPRASSSAPRPSTTPSATSSASTARPSGRRATAQAFLEAYAGEPLSVDEEALLAAYVADKAVYEAVYETRNRPSWVSIPMAAIARIDV